MLSLQFLGKRKYLAELTRVIDLQQRGTDQICAILKLRENMLLYVFIFQITQEKSKLENVEITQSQICYNQTMAK